MLLDRYDVRRRDAERGGGVTIAQSRDANHVRWAIEELWPSPVGQWEPSYDIDRWRRDGRLSLFVQRVGQGDGESLEDVPAQPVTVLYWSP